MPRGEENPQQTMPLIPGLRGIENLTDTEKTVRITIIADDVISAITQIAQMKNSGVLRRRNTRPIDDMIDTFGSTDRSHRRELEHLIRRRERSLRTLSRKHRDEVQDLVKSAAAGFTRLRRRAERLNDELRVTKQKLAERELQYLAAVARNERHEQRMERKEIARRDSGVPREEDKERNADCK